jgi:hypothetical protein
MDVASSEFYVPEDGMYDLDFKNKPNDGSQKKTKCGPWKRASPPVCPALAGPNCVAR